MECYAARKSQIKLHTTAQRDLRSILLQERGKSLKIHIVSVYLCKVQNMQLETEYRQTQWVKPRRCTRDAREPTTRVVGTLVGRGNEMQLGRNPQRASKFMTNSTPPF